MKTTKLALLALGLLTLAGSVPAYAQARLLNVSYDPTRELCQDINRGFSASWKAKTGQTVEVEAVARRLEHPGPGGHRRSRGRRRHASRR